MTKIIPNDYNRDNIVELGESIAREINRKVSDEDRVTVINLLTFNLVLFSDISIRDMEYIGEDIKQMARYSHIEMLEEEIEKLRKELKHPMTEEEYEKAQKSIIQTQEGNKAA